MNRLESSGLGCVKSQKSKSALLTLLLSTASVQCLRNKEGLENAIAAQKASDDEESLSPIVKPDVDAIRKVSRDYLKRHPDNSKEALVTKDVKKLIRKFANSSDNDWKKFFDSPAFSKHLESHELLTKGETSNSDHDKPKSPGHLSQKGLITILSLATVATAANLGISLSFRRTNGHFCIYNKSLLASMGLSSATIAFLVVAMQLEKPGKDFDKVIAKLGIGAGALIAIQALGIGGFVAKDHPVRVSGGLLDNIARITGRTENTVKNDLKQVFDLIEGNHRRILTKHDKDIVRKYVQDNIAKEKIPISEDDLRSAKKVFDNLKRPTATSDQLSVLNQLLDSYVTPDLLSVGNYIETLPDRPGLVRALKGNLRVKGESFRALLVKNFNRVRSSMKSYLASKNIDNNFLFEDDYINYTLDYIILRERYKMPPAVMADQSKFPANETEWNKAMEKSWEMRLKYKVIKGPLYTTEAGEINKFFEIQKHRAELAQVKVQSVMASVVGLSAGIAIMATAAAAKGPLGLADQDDLESFFREIGLRASKIQELVHQI